MNLMDVLGTISSVIHIKAEMTLAKASDEMPEAFPIRAWQDSRYYFYGKGAAGHHCAISHVYSEPTRAKSRIIKNKNRKNWRNQNYVNSFFFNKKPLEEP